MELTVGTVLEGKVKSLTGFGAFITLPGGATGMVHISEVARAFVNDIREHLTEGQSVRVMVIGTENGKISLSIKRALPAEPARAAKPRRQTPCPVSDPQQPRSFDDMLKQFMSESDSKMSSSRIYSDHKTKTRKR